jgi:hypothetical protein
MPHTVTIADTGEHYACTGDESLLSAMARLGGGDSGGVPGRRLRVCKVEVLSGDFHTRAMSRDHVSDDDRACHRLLACRCTRQRSFPEGDRQAARARLRAGHRLMNCV